MSAEVVRLWVAAAVERAPELAQAGEKLYPVLAPLPHMDDAAIKKVWSRETGLFKLPFHGNSYELARLQVEIEGKHQLNRDWLEEVDVALTGLAEQLEMAEVIECVALLEAMSASVLAVPFCKRFNALIQDQPAELRLANMTALLAS